MLKTATFYDAVLTFYNLFINMRAHTCHTKTVKTLSVLPILIHYLLNAVGGLILFFISFKRFNQWDFYPTQIGFALAEYFHNENLTLSQPLKAGRRHSTVQQSVCVCIMYHIRKEGGGMFIEADDSLPKLVSLQTIRESPHLPLHLRP